jgi:hypothetical protein
MLIVEPPSGAVIVPPQVELGLAGVASVTPVGKVSTNANSITGVGLGLVMVNDKTLPLPGPMVLGRKLFENKGGSARAEEEKSSKVNNRYRIEI